ncbi:MAG: aldo/keto reductase [Lachnospiraceae bacterium]|nr:aldo/keto reductase [Lachnospiraceae bacterium]
MKLCLGTVQLGMRYGIHNQIKRQPTKEEAYKILWSAKEYGIKCLDTASAYGNAEELIGESGVLDDGDIRIITKPDAQSRLGIRNEVEQSLKRLKQECIDGLLLHDVSCYYDEKNLAELLKIKEEGLVKCVGVSVYEPEDALRIAGDGEMDYIQIPYNVFDQRLDQTDFFERTEKNGVTVFARSSFLQGLILMEPNQIPKKLWEAKLYIEKFKAIIQEYGFSAAEAAVLFCYTNERIDYVVFGVDTIEQLSENIEITKKADLFRECKEALIGITDGIHEHILNPGLWEV